MRNNKSETKRYYTLKELQEYIDTLNVLDNTKVYTIDVRDKLRDEYKPNEELQERKEPEFNRHMKERVDITQDVANFIEEYNYTIEENGNWIECNELYTDYILYTEQPTKPTRTAVTKALTKVGLLKGITIKIKVKKNKERKSIRVYTNIFKQNC